MNINKSIIILLTLVTPSLTIGKVFSSENIVSSRFESNNSVSKLEYQSASVFSHLKWSPGRNNPVKIEVLPIVNFSGIPIEQREEKSDYFNHGKIPQSVNHLFSDLVSASRYFTSNDANSDYRFQLTINRYRLPYDYAPDDLWWKKLNTEVDRWLVTPKSARISLSLKITGKQRHIAAWSRTIETSLAFCDLNAQTQPLTSFNNKDQIVREYVKTTPGQAFIAASNFLILQGIHYINQKRGLAQVAGKFENELLLVSNDDSFVVGEILGLYHKNEYSTQSALPAGQVQIIKTFENQAIAYPIDIRADQIKQGDWVEVSTTHPYVVPKSVFSPKNQCAQVSVAEL